MKKMSTSDVVFVLTLLLFFLIGVVVMRDEDLSILQDKVQVATPEEKEQLKGLKVNDNGSIEY